MSMTNKVKAFPLHEGDILGMADGKTAFENMVLLHDNGIETCLHSYWNGTEYALEIVYIPTEKGKQITQEQWEGI